LAFSTRRTVDTSEDNVERGGRSKDADSSRMGKAAEYLVASTCIIASRAEINVSTALVDDEGVDLIFHRRDVPSTLAVQVKARFSDAKTIRDGTYRANVRRETCSSRVDFYILFVLIDVANSAVARCWLVPSRDFIERATCDSLGRYRFTASVKADSRDQWSPYRLTAADLPGKILRTLNKVDSYPRTGQPEAANALTETPGATSVRPERTRLAGKEY
jgi:hypothetical protein